MWRNGVKSVPYFERATLKTETTKTRRANWTVTKDQILQPGEMVRVLADLSFRSKRSLNSRMNAIIFRLASFCGLRASEISGLTLADVLIDSTAPKIKVRPEVAKGGKGRRVPLTWDQATLDAIRGWKLLRIGQGAKPGDPFICSQRVGSHGHTLDRQNLRQRFKCCCRCLGSERRQEITIHMGRHSFISHAIHGGRTIVEVRDAAGHSSLNITNLYSHLVEGDYKVGDLFAFAGREKPAVTTIAGPC